MSEESRQTLEHGLHDVDDLADWSVHPSGDEWILMYRQGLSKRQIAEVCATRLSRVSRRINQAISGDESLEPAHVANLPVVVVIDPARARWIGWFEEVRQFTKAQGRLPSKNEVGSREMRLSVWLGQQRGAYRGGNLSQEYQHLLDSLGSWQISERQRREEQAWQEHLGQLQDYVAREGSWPVWRQTESEEERAVGAWLHAQRQGFKRGKLHPDRITALNNAVPGWYDPRRRTRLLSRPVSMPALDPSSAGPQRRHADKWLGRLGGQRQSFLAGSQEKRSGLLEV